MIELISCSHPFWPQNRQTLSLLRPMEACVHKLLNDHFSKLLVTPPTSQLIPQPFCRFTYVTALYPTLPLLHLRHSSLSNPSFASPTSSGELPMLLYRSSLRRYYLNIKLSAFFEMLGAQYSLEPCSSSNRLNAWLFLQYIFVAACIIV